MMTCTFRKARAGVGLAVAALVLTFSARASALDRFEIQVYEADVNKPWQLALEVHTNYTVEGSKTPSYAGEVPPHHVGRLTLEPALGITSWLELGVYLQAMVAPDQGLAYGGAKVRAKMVIPSSWKWPVFAGLNVELGKVPQSVEEDGWANELRPIIGFGNGYIVIVGNPIVGYALSGPDRFKPDFEPAGKVAFNTQLGFSLGAEYFAGLGQFGRGLSPLREQEHLLFGVFDLAAPAGQTGSPWEVNVAVGHALTAAYGPSWIAKSIVGRSF